jgi:hypothetical protein
MLTGELPKTHPSGAQMIWTGPSTIGEKIINADEEQVEIALSEIYGGWGFTFEQTGLGDAIIVTSNNQEDLNRSTLKNMTSSEQQDYKLKNGISVEIDLQSFTEEGAKKEVEKLKNFIDGNYNKTGYIDSTLDDIYQAAKKGDHKQFRRIYNEDVIENEIGKLKELDKELTASIPQYEQDYFQWNQRFDAYDKQLFDLESKIEAFDKNVDSIGLAVESGTVLYEEAEKFYNDAEKERQALLSEKKDEGGELQKRYEDIQQAKNKITSYDPEKLQVIAAEQASHLASHGTVGGSLWESFLGAIDSRNTAMASFGIDMMGIIQKNLLDEGQWQVNAKVVGQDKEGNPIYETKDQYFNRQRKEVKEEILPYIQNVYKDAFGTDVTNEYQQKFQETTFGAITTSLSQLAAHGVTTLGNPTALGISFGGQIYGDLTTEMMDEKYDEMTENEKMVVAGTVSLVAGALEKIGFSKLFPGGSKISQTILTRALGRIKGKASYETIEQAIEMEVASLPKAFFRTINSMGAEGVTEGLQAGSEMGIKGIYNWFKENKVFEDTDILTKQGAKRILYDAYVGALAGGSIGTVTAGIQAHRENAIGKLNKEQFESVKLFATDANFREIYFFQLQGEVQDKSITPEQAKKRWADLNSMVSLFEQTDGLNLDPKLQQEAFSLLNEKNKLKEQIAGKDENLTKAQQDRIKAIDVRLGRISEGIQAPSYKIDGQEVMEQDLINKLNDPAFKEKVKTGEVNIDVKDPSPEVAEVYDPFVEEISETQVTEETTSIEERVGLGETITERNQEWDVTEKDNLPETGKTTEEFTEELKTGTWGMLTAENPNAQQETDQFNEAANEKAKKWLEEKGYKPVSIFGKYENSEKSFYVPGLTSADAIAFAKEFNQESVATDQGLIYQDGTMNPINKGQEEIGVEKDNYYSTIKTSEGNVDFAVSYDFDTTTEVEMDTETTTETETDAPQRKADKIIEGLEKLKKDLDQPGTLQVNLFPGQDKAVKAAIDITIGAIKAGDAVVQAIEAGYKKLKELGFKGSLEDYQNYLVQNPDVEITEADITVEEEVTEEAAPEVSEERTNLDNRLAEINEELDKAKEKDLKGRDFIEDNIKNINAEIKKLQEKGDENSLDRIPELEEIRDGFKEELNELDQIKEIEKEKKEIEDKIYALDIKGISVEERKKRQKEQGVILKEKGDSFITRIAKNVKQKKINLLNARKAKPKDLFRAQEKQQATIDSYSNTVKNTAADFNKAFANFKGNNKAKEELIDAVNLGLDGKMNKKTGVVTRADGTTITLPENFKNLVNSMRNQIDVLSLELMNSGAITIEQYRKIKSNLGEYLNTDYEVFTNPNWRKEVSKDVVNTARNFLYQQYEAMLEAGQTDIIDIVEGETKQEALDRTVANTIDEILNPENSKIKIGESFKEKRQVALFKQKNINIPPAIQALMGQYNDPIQRYAQSVIKLGSEVSTIRYLNQIKESGKGVYFFTKGNRPKGFTYQIAPEGTTTLSPLGGLYTTPEIGEALTNNTDEISKTMRRVMQVQSVVKWGKTIGSVGTHTKNVVGNVGFMMLNGHNPFDVKTMGEAYNQVRMNLYPESDKVRKGFVRKKISEQEKQAIRDKYNKYVELGIINQSTSLGMMRDMIKDANWNSAMEARLNRDVNTVSKAGKYASKKAKAAVKFAEDLYQAEDDFFKIVAYEKELDRYSQAYFKKKKGDLNEEELSQIEEIAADNVKNLYPNYARVGQVFKNLRKNPFVGNFVSFQAEVFRTTANTVSLIRKEITSDNPEIRKLGAKRLRYLGQYLGVKVGANYFLASTIGAGLSGMLDAGDEDDKLMRRLLPPWAQNSTLYVLGSGDGVLDYIDLSASDPHGQVDRILNAVLSGEDLTESVVGGIAESLSPFLGEDITFTVASALTNNKTKFGKAIYNPEDDIEDIITDCFLFAANTLGPGTGRSIQKVMKEFQKDDGSPWWEIVGQATGIKPSHTDVYTAAIFKTKDTKKRINNANKLYTDIFYERDANGNIITPTPKEKQEAYDKAVKRREEIYKEAILDYKAYELTKPKTTGKESIYTSMSKGGFTPDEIKNIINGQIPEYIPPDEVEAMQQLKIVEEEKQTAKEEGITYVKLDEKDEAKVQELLNKYEYIKTEDDSWKWKSLNKNQIERAIKVSKEEARMSLNDAIKREQNINKEQLRMSEEKGYEYSRKKAAEIVDGVRDRSGNYISN